MPMQQYDELTESNKLFIDMWSIIARRFPEGKVEVLPGVTATLSGSAFVFYNVISLSSPVRDTADFAERCRIAIERGKESGQPWLLSVCQAWAGDLEAANEVLAGLGFKLMLVNTGMVTDELLPPRRPPPGELEIRRVHDEETRNAVGDLNCLSYHIPIELGRTTISRESLWDDSVFGFVGFVNGEPVSCCVTVPVDGRLYGSLGATHPDHRRMGYCEAVMRRAVEEAAAATGLRRLVFHATDAGLPLYAEMGCRSVVPFSWYMLA